MNNLPTGTVTFLFTDIEGSTKLWQQHPGQMPAALAHHHAILNEAIAANDGYVFQIIGDAFCAAFSAATDGLAAALAAQRALRDATWGETGAIRVRMALHTGAAEIRVGEFTSGEYVSGLTLSRVARLLSAGHGGQILLSLPAAELVRDHLPKDVTWRDMGARRLKDLIRPEQIFQVVTPDLPAEFAPLKTLDIHPHNLPVQLTSFIGREKEQRELKELLGKTHLLTLTGAGGTGKTRLSLQVAADLIDEFPDGVWFVELAPLTDPGLISQTVASLLGLREEAGRPVMTLLSDYLRAKTALIILDNCEHLIEACAKFADTILHVAPKVNILATSREALGIAGETAYRVPSLSLPPKDFSLRDLASLSQFEAVRLFIDRARAVKTDFAVTNANAPAVAQICHRLDGIPLALELAAARVKSLSVEQIAARLDDRFRLLTGGSRTALPRQQTLRAAIDWSFSLLTEEERVLLRRLSVFAGGWTLDAAQAVCSCDPVCADDVVDLLAHLVDKSLVIFEQRDNETRYRLMETIRQYARDRLMESIDAETVRDRHLDYFVAYAEEVEPRLRGAEQFQWLDRLEVEHDNLRAVLEWSQGAERVQKGLRLAAALTMFWLLMSYWREGQESVERLLSKPEAGGKTLARAQALYAAALCIRPGNRKLPLEYFEEVIAIARELGQIGKKILALALADWGNRRWQDSTLARSRFEEAWKIGQELGDPWTIAFLLLIQGRSLHAQRDYKAERPIVEECIALFRKTGDVNWATLSLRDLAMLNYREGDYATARSQLEQVLLFFRQANFPARISATLTSLGEIARSEGDYALARQYYEQALAIAQDQGNQYNICIQQGNLGVTVLRLGDVNQGRKLLVESLTSSSKRMGQDWIVIGLLEGLAFVAVVQNQTQRAVQFFGAIDSLAKLMNLSATDRSPADEAEIEHYLAIARAQLDEATFNAAWAGGQKMTLEQAVELALKEVGGE